MIFKVENLGKIKEAEVDLNKDLILLTGQNNTGKTYLAYTIYGFLNVNHPQWSRYMSVKGEEEVSGEIEIDIQRYIDSELFTEEYLDLKVGFPFKTFFQTSFPLGNKQHSSPKIDYQVIKKDELDYFKRKIYEKEIVRKKLNFTFYKSLNSNKLIITVDKDEVNRESTMHMLTNLIIRSEIYPPYILFFPAERSAVNIFNRELAISKNDFLDFTLKMQEDYRSEFLNFLEKKINRYPKPIQDSLKIAEDLALKSKQKSEFSFLADELENNILGGKISVSEYGDLRFKPENSEISPLETHLTGSMIKSLAGISFYLRHMAQKHDCIIIDEPEINLHPDNQRKIARFFGRLINEGFKVIISTHSDYIIKEINNLVMLSKESETQKELLKKYNYAENELIKPERIEALLFRKSNDNEQITPEKIEVDAQGLSVDTIDEELDKLNNVAENIYFQLFENQ